GRVRVPVCRASAQMREECVGIATQGELTGEFVERSARGLRERARVRGVALTGERAGTLDVRCRERARVVVARARDRVDLIEQRSRVLPLVLVDQAGRECEQDIGAVIVYVVQLGKGRERATR